MNISRPEDGAFPTYFSKYIDLVEGEIMGVLNKQRKQMKKFLFSDINLSYTYAPGKWSVRQSITHLIDTERVFAYRALCFSRGESKSLPGFEQDEYAEQNWDHLDAGHLWKEYNAVRKSTIALYRNMNMEMLGRQGDVAGNNLSVSAIPYILAGHQIHHMKLFKSKYHLHL